MTMSPSLFAAPGSSATTIAESPVWSCCGATSAIPEADAATCSEGISTSADADAAAAAAAAIAWIAAARSSWNRLVFSACWAKNSGGGGGGGGGGVSSSSSTAGPPSGSVWVPISPVVRRHGRRVRSCSNHRWSCRLSSSWYAATSSAVADRGRGARRPAILPMTWAAWGSLSMVCTTLCSCWPTARPRARVTVSTMIVYSCRSGVCTAKPTIAMVYSRCCWNSSSSLSASPVISAGHPSVVNTVTGGNSGTAELISPISSESPRRRRSMFAPYCTPPHWKTDPGEEARDLDPTVELL